MSRISREKGLEPEGSVQVDCEADQRSKRSPELLLHGIEILQDEHLQETDLHAHEARMMNRWAISNPYLREETRAELWSRINLFNNQSR